MVWFRRSQKQSSGSVRLDESVSWPKKYIPDTSIQVPSYGLDTGQQFQVTSAVTGLGITRDAPQYPDLVFLAAMLYQDALYNGFTEALPDESRNDFWTLQHLPWKQQRIWLSSVLGGEAQVDLLEVRFDRAFRQQLAQAMASKA